MLPSNLKGPGETITSLNAEAFISDNSGRYPNLDPDFISQICFEHPTRFDSFFPGFNPQEHTALRTERSASWIKGNIRYDNDDDLRFWFKQFDDFRSAGKGSKVFEYMIEHRNWSFPPVIVEWRFAQELGAPSYVGRPYYLVEGTHRVSYLLRMLELGLVKETDSYQLIVITPNQAMESDT
ncbi:hypothetical protein Nhal_0238 [Nitrosococcus halophilus Nc 4]|uniref:Uncharacterized protein n=2 Tax=Nitrosococcus halophilus TaxID=133539 RepID=D5BUP1_NITHN|nr:hypothetical protein Nhal_0238 [Nitrosococcus halophilus Nc 4]